MIATQARTVFVGGLMLLLLVGAWWLSAPDPTSQEVPRGVATGPNGRGHLTVQLPGDLDDAHARASDFTLALFKNDVDTVASLATPALATPLLSSGRGSAGPDDGADVVVDAVTTEDAGADRLLLQVVVRRGGGAAGGLELVTVAMVRTSGGWRVDDVAF